MNPVKAPFAMKMAMIRKQLSFRDFSAAIMQKTGVSISHSTLHDYENTGNDIMPKPKNLAVLAQYAGKPLSWFYEEVPDEYKNGEQLVQDTLDSTREESDPHYTTSEFACEVARYIAQEGAHLTETEQSFLLNMIKTYIASVPKRE